MRIAASDTRDISRGGGQGDSPWENDLRYRSLEYRYCIAWLLLSGTRSFEDSFVSEHNMLDSKDFEVSLGLVLQEVLRVVILQLLLARKK